MFVFKKYGIPTINWIHNNILKYLTRTTYMERYPSNNAIVVGAIAHLSSCTIKDGYEIVDVLEKQDLPEELKEVVTA